MKRSYLFAGEILFVAAMIGLACLFYIKHTPAGAVPVNIKLADSRSQVCLVRGGDGYQFLVQGPGVPSETISPDQFAQRLYRDGSESSGWAKVLGPMSPTLMTWLGIGFVGQVLFTGRMIVQWLASEKKKKSVVTPLFWWMSLAGSLLLLSYFLWRRDPIGLLGQAFGIFVYLNNLYLIYGKHHPEEIAVTKETAPAT